MKDFISKVLKPISEKGNLTTLILVAALFGILRLSGAAVYVADDSRAGTSFAAPVEKQSAAWPERGTFPRREKAPAARELAPTSAVSEDAQSERVGNKTLEDLEREMGLR